MKSLLSRTLAELERSVVTYEEVPRLEWGVRCPRLDRRVPLADCLGCAYHQATIASGLGYGVFCRFPSNLTSLPPTA